MRSIYIYIYDIRSLRVNIVTGINVVELFVTVLFSDMLLSITALKKSGLTTCGVNLINALNSNSRNCALMRAL